ncbi:MAG: MltA domain-containing protein [Alphaproteobacteria bacterium]|nr:MltA domain-containing protein [Alphaproteobacteria bacterium]
MTSARSRCGLVRIFARAGGAALILAIAAGATVSTPALARNPLKLPDTQYEPTSWTMVDGWADDDHTAAFEAFTKSCKAILQGPAKRDGSPMLGALYKICEKASVANPQKPGAARVFFEQNFRPIRISPLGTPDGFLTGYYEPIVEGVRAKSEGYEVPLYRKPSNLLPGGRMAVAGAPAPAADEAGKSKGKKKNKHAAKRRLVPFHDRSAIEDGVLAGRDLEICWLKDPIDSFFAQIQGSLRVLLDDGRLMRLNYSAANGHPYYAVGRWLIDRGIVAKEEMSMDRIREWMTRNPKEGDELRRRNKSYVFFRETSLASNEEPIGAQGISLTPGRSIAVDRKLHTYGTPFFISGYLPIEGLTADTWFKRLMIAQDTGGAIIGPARADLYFGAGDEAATVAGRMRHPGRFVMLLPKSLDPSKDEDDDEIPLPRPRPTDFEAVVAATEKATEVKLETAKAETAKPEIRSAAKADAKPEPKAAEKKAEKAAETKKPDTKAKLEAKPDAKANAKSGPESKAESKPKAEATTAAKVDAKATIETKSKTAAKPEAKSGAKSEAKSEAKTETKAKPVAVRHDPPT